MCWTTGWAMRIERIDAWPDQARQSVQERRWDRLLRCQRLQDVAQALYQRGGEDWRIGYPILRDQLAKRQRIAPGNPSEHGSWVSTVWWMRGQEAKFYGTSIGCFTLAIPNRYLPILQEGKTRG